ncbi:eCIS core domain-containing protein [Streptomyces diastatochromogenes]|uniref:eCIS core domain-containing protein n=1 Tax=Streptomyces diastatochromogenes TaxID=42236 RepID=UPI0036AF3589
MGLARDENTAAGKERAPQRPRATPTSAGTAVQRMLALQSDAGNQAVVERLRRAGHPGAQDRHQHGPGCGHQSQEPPVQRSSGDATVARAEEEDGHVHGRVQDTSPEGQSALLAAAMNSPSESLPSSVVAKAGAFYQNDRLSSTRVHRDAVAQRATAAMGAQAMTIGNHIFLAAGTAGDEKLIGHELSHVDKNLKGIPETGHSNSAGVTVTDPKQGSERAAEKDGDAYAAAETTAPSLVAQRRAANGSHETVQRMMEEDQPAGRRIALQDPPLELSAEDHIAGLPEDSEQEVYLKRGVTPAQRLHLQREVIRGSFVSLQKILRTPDENAAKPDSEDVTGYVNQARNERTAELIEFSTNAKTATHFASEARLGLVLTVRIKRKYLAKGSSGEFGWIAKQGAPYDIVAIERKDTLEEGVSPMTEEEFREAVKTEEMAEYLLKIQDPSALVAHMNQFQGAQKVEEAKKIAAYKAAVFK